MSNTTNGVRLDAKDSERQIVSIAISDPGALSRIESEIDETVFTDQFNGRVLSAILRLKDAGVDPDLLTVSQSLPNETPSDIANLTSDYLTSSNLDFHLRTVKDMAARRALLRLAQHLAKAVKQHGNDILDVFHDATDELVAIERDVDVGRFLEPAELASVADREITASVARQGDITGLSTGFPRIDNLTDGLQPGALYVIGARPGAGKTSMAIQIAAHIASTRRQSVAFFTFEQSHREIVRRLLSAGAGIDSVRLAQGWINGDQEQQLRKVAGVLGQSKLYVCDNPRLTVDEIRSQVLRLTVRNGVRVLFLDYLSLITPRDRTRPRYEQVSEISNELKLLTRELNIPVVALQQLTRGAQDRRPALNDLRESGSIEQDADVVVMIHREPDDEYTMVSGDFGIQLIVAKNRNGPIGDIAGRFTGSTTRFELVGE